MAGEYIGLRMNPSLADRIHREANRRGITDSELIREILSEYFVADESITQRLAEQIIGRLSQAVSAGIRDVWSEDQVAALGGALTWAVLKASKMPDAEIASIVQSVQGALLRKE